MKKSGIFSLIVYVLMTALSGFSAIKWRIELDNLAQNSEGGAGWAGLGIAILLILAIAVFAVSLVAMICKILHVAKGWSFFGVLCTLIDGAAVGYIGYLLIPTLPTASLTSIAELWYVFAFWAVMIASFVANVISLKK